MNEAVVKLLIAEIKELLRNAEYADGTAVVLTHDCEAVEDALGKLDEGN